MRVSDTLPGPVFSRWAVCLWPGLYVKPGPWSLTSGTQGPRYCHLVARQALSQRQGGV